MAFLNPESSFQAWVLTTKEFQQGSLLTLTQKQCIQNQVVQLAEERLALNYDAQNPSAFLQREAEIKGAIGALKYLLNVSNITEGELSQNPTNQFSPQE